MYKLTTNVDLTAYSTFGVPARAACVVAVNTAEDIEAAREGERFTDQQPLILGAGSNTLFVGDYTGWILHPAVSGISIVEENDDFIWLDAGAGVNWHNLVEYSVSQDWSGIENLALIPGNVGAAPVQNIGAYGMELAQVFAGLKAFDLKQNRIVEFDSSQAEFGYRRSYFKNHPELVILNVVLKLSKKFFPKIQYRGLKEILGDRELTPRTVMEAVIALRRSKLPDTAELGSGGSFFKNPILGKTEIEQLLSEYPQAVVYRNTDGSGKVAAAWLIEQCGWKGVRRGNCGVYGGHALVLVNYGGATGRQIWQLAQDIIHSVEDKFSITLEPEVRIAGGD